MAPVTRCRGGLHPRKDYPPDMSALTTLLIRSVAVKAIVITIRIILSRA